ncbi:MaoC like domain [Nesidiocoris tenuis]|uniref:MaoC like domain n=1 Tax=Nesidiocoris tenuis TaxID=355587 RepID=A0ABN7BDX1_9HEMI|nr:MaoC like domain [Nesidiocoris tenuis]
MYSSKERLKKRTGKNKVDRPEFLKLLVQEYRTTKSSEAKRQVLANLANFAYDPINYEWLRNLDVVQLFLEELASADEKIVEFAIGGLCNLCLDFKNKDLILGIPGGLSSVKNCLNSSNQETVNTAVTLLMYLITPKSKPAIKTEDTLELMVAFSRNPNKRVSNLARIFLEDYCDPCEVTAAERRVDRLLQGQIQNEVSSIPLPEFSGKRLVTRDDVESFAKLSGDFNPIHFKDKKPIVHGALLNSFLSGVIGTKLPGPGTILSSQNFRYPNPCYAEDIIVIQVSVERLRKITTCEYRISRKSDDATLMEGSAKVIIRMPSG